jgi:hypothetical protein
MTTWYEIYAEDNDADGGIFVTKYTCQMVLDGSSRSLF